MKPQALAILLLIGGCASNGNHGQGDLPLPDTASIERPENDEAARLVNEFLRLMDENLPLVDPISVLNARDQYTRQVFINMFSDPDLDPDVRTAFQEYGGIFIEQMDAINTEQLKSLLAETNWRSLAERESNLFEKAWSIVQHSNDEAFRTSVLSEIEPLVQEGLIEGQHYALMYDRVQLKKDGTQLFGSQTKCIDGQYDVYGLSEPELVDERRAALGMEPLAVYLKRNREYYGACGG